MEESTPAPPPSKPGSLREAKAATADETPSEAATTAAASSMSSDDEMSYTEHEKGHKYGVIWIDDRREPAAPAIFPLVTRSFPGSNSAIHQLAVGPRSHRSPPALARSDAPTCMLCDASWSLIRRRHHCRRCGRVVCDACSPARQAVAASNNRKRVCVRCVDSSRAANLLLMGVGTTRGAQRPG